MPGSGTRRAIAPLLVVEDDDDTRTALVELLENEGYSVRAVGDGASALAALRVERFRLMILDLLLPDMHGSELRRRQLAEPALVVPAIVITADSHGGIETLPTLRKPFDIEDLLTLVRDELEAADRQRSQDLLSAMGDVRRQLAKTMSDLDVIRRTRAEDQAPPSAPLSRRR